jgi:hypothetical protein
VAGEHTGVLGPARLVDRLDHLDRDHRVEAARDRLDLAAVARRKITPAAAVCTGPRGDGSGSGT